MPTHDLYVIANLAITTSLRGFDYMHRMLIKAEKLVNLTGPST